MISVALSFLPSLLDWLPHILGGAGVGVSVLGFIPGLRPILKWAPWVLALAGVLGLLWYRAEYKQEVAGRLADKAAALEEVAREQKKAAALSDELVIQQAIAMAVTSKKAGNYVEQIRKAPDAERRRIGSRGVRDLIQGGGGGPPALGGAPAAVPGP